jgi:hypothetical protein
MVDPFRDIDLVAGEEGNGGANAVDGGAIGEVLLEIKAEAFLRASAEPENDMSGAALLETAEKLGVLRRGTVHGSEVNVVVGDVDVVLAEPRDVAFRSVGVGHHPEADAGLAELIAVDEGAKIAETGELGNIVMLDEVTEHDHEGTISDGEVRAEKRVPISLVVREILQSRSSGNYDHATIGGDLVNGIVCRADQEANSQDLLKAD